MNPTKPGLGQHPGAQRSFAKPALMVVTGVVTVALLGLMVIANRSFLPRPATFHGTLLPSARTAPDVPLVDDRGELVHLTMYQGQVVVLTFGYTSCPDACPMTLARLSDARRALGQDGQRVRIFLVTVDPQRDTPERLGAFVQRFDPTFGGLTGTPEAVAQLYQAFGVLPQPERGLDDAAAYPAAHPSVTYVLDRQSRLRLAYPPNAQPEHIAADLRVLLRGGFN